MVFGMKFSNVGYTHSLMYMLDTIALRERWNDNEAFFRSSLLL